MKSTTAIALSFFLPQVCADPGTLTIANLPGAADEDNLVCYDQSTGKLGNCHPDAAGKPARIVWVSKDGGGDYDDPVQALDDVANWCPARSVSNPCLIRIAPGSWSMGSTTIDMVPYVDIQGSGVVRANASGLAGTAPTTILGTVSGTSVGVINGAANSTLSDLKVANHTTGVTGIAIYNRNNDNFRVERVLAEADGATGWVYGLRNTSTTQQSRVFVKDSTFLGVGDGSARGILVESAGSNNAEVGLSRCTVFAHSGSTSNIAILLDTVNSEGVANALIRYSDIPGTVKTQGAGRVQTLVEFSALNNAQATASGPDSWIACHFVTSGLFIHTDTCPPPPGI